MQLSCAVQILHTMHQFLLNLCLSRQLNAIRLQLKFWHTYTTLRARRTVEVPDGLEKGSAQINSNHGFVAYSDSSWGNKYPYPMFGCCVYLFGGLVSFTSKQMKMVALSSCEAEYIAAAACCKEITFIRNVCADMGVILTGPLVLAVDNTAAIEVAYNNGASARTKHFNMSNHYFRDLVLYGYIKPIHIVTSKQRADGYTKSLEKSKFLVWVDTQLK